MNTPELSEIDEDFRIYKIDVRVRSSFALISAVNINTATTLPFVPILLILNIEFRNKDALLKSLKTGIKVVSYDKRIISNITTSNTNSLLWDYSLLALELR
jgi:hypothetical protein